jgi:very-short-patch-repair endonuclease
MTDAERRLWYFLRGSRFQGWKFRRQVPMGPYVADFLCERARLVVEVDGGQHGDNVKRDEARTRWLEARGYRVVRYWNNDVLGNTDGVLTALIAELVQSR